MDKSLIIRISVFLFPVSYLNMTLNNNVSLINWLERVVGLFDKLSIINPDL